MLRGFRVGPNVEVTVTHPRYGVHTRLQVGRTYCQLQCDHCSVDYERQYAASVSDQVEHFCSRRCSQTAHQHLRIAAGASPEAIERRRLTNIERYGVGSVLALKSIHDLANTPEKCQQRHETMKKNGSYFKSKPEDQLHSYLVAKFGADDVERPKIVNGWPIDFHVKSIDTYVQLDGAYWHGLDRPLEEIAKFKTPRDRTILRKHQIDRGQDEWFRTVGKRLVRITDRELAQGEIPDDLK